MIKVETVVFMQNKLNRYIDKTFLLIDDFVEFRHSLKMMVEAIGATHICQASCGQEAIALYSQYQHDFILLDFNLGDGINGLQLLAELGFKDILRQDTIVILVTAETSLDMVMGAIDIRPDEYLAKPFTKVVLKQRLDRAFEKKDAIKPVYQCLNNKDYSMAISWCDKLISSSAKYQMACHRIKADCLLRLGKPQQAQEIYTTALASRALNWALLGRARCKVHRSMYIEAIGDFDKIIETNRFALEAYDQKAESLLAIGEYEDAYRILQQAVAISPNSAYRQRTTACLAIRYHDYDVAVIALRKVISLTRHLSQKQPDDYLKLAQTLSLIHGGHMGQQSRRAPIELSRLLKVMQTEFSANKQLLIAATIHQAIYDFMTGHENDGEIKIKQASARLEDLPDEFKPFLLDEIIFAHKICSERPLVETLYQKWYGDNASPVINENTSKANSFNRQGVSNFRQKDFEKAFLAFKAAYLNARDNVNITLNLMQVMVKLINKDAIKTEFPELLEMFCQTYKLLDLSDQRTTHFKLLYKNIKTHLVNKQVEKRQVHEQH